MENLNLEKDVHIQMEGSQRSPIRFNLNKFLPRHNQTFKNQEEKIEGNKAQKANNT